MTPTDSVFQRALSNGKQEAFWGTLEGRLMMMLDGALELTLEFLSQATQAWMEIEYNRTVHREIFRSPVERLAHIDYRDPKSVNYRDHSQDRAGARWPSRLRDADLVFLVHRDRGELVLRPV
jgi:hypothetical protein